MGTCSDFKGLFSRRYKEIGISDSDIQPHSSSRDKETGNKNVITEQSAAGAHRSFISRAYIEVPIALSAGNQAHLPLIYLILAGIHGQAPH